MHIFKPQDLAAFDRFKSQIRPKAPPRPIPFRPKFMLLAFGLAALVWYGRERMAALEESRPRKLNLMSQKEEILKRLQFKRLFGYRLFSQMNQEQNSDLLNRYVRELQTLLEFLKQLEQTTTTVVQKSECGLKVLGFLAFSNKQETEYFDQLGRRWLLEQKSKIKIFGLPVLKQVQKRRLSDQSMVVFEPQFSFLHLFKPPPSNPDFQASSGCRALFSYPKNGGEEESAEWMARCLVRVQGLSDKIDSWLEENK